MKKTCLILMCLAFACALSQAAPKKVTIKGTVVNYTANDSVELYDALGRQKNALEKAPVEKGQFKLHYNPTETGYYVLRFPTGKNVLAVLVPDRTLELTVDAQSGMIREAKNSPENQLLHTYQEYLMQLEMKKDSLVRAHQETPDPDIQRKFLRLEEERVNYLASLCLGHADNYATAALMENLKYDQAPEVFDSVFTCLYRKYPKDPYVQYRVSEVENNKFLSPGSEAPDFTLADTNGVKVSLSDFRGKVVVIDFWASWCRPCRQENPNMVRLYKSFHDKGLEILGVSLDNDRRSWMDAIHKDGLYWTQISDLKQWECVVARQYRVSGIPFTVLIDRDGKVVAKGLRGNELRQRVEALLNQE